MWFGLRLNLVLMDELQVFKCVLRQLKLGLDSFKVELLNIIICDTVFDDILLI